jgi:hypothetical protein
MVTDHKLDAVVFECRGISKIRFIRDIQEAVIEIHSGAESFEEIPFRSGH